MSQFGLQEYTENILGLPDNISKLIKSHRGLSDFDKNKPFYVYTGRGPSQSTFHIGHLPGLYVAKALMSSEKLFFMLSDDEKFLRDGINLVHFAVDTIKQLKQLGFNESNTQFNINSEGMTKEFYIMALKISRVINQNTLNNSFGTKSNIGEMFYPIIQMVPCFLFSKQCIVIAGEDQDPFFRLARDVARKLKLLPPIILYTINVPGLNGSQKMSTSIPESKPIFLTDTIERITEAVNKISIVGAGVQLLPSFYTIFTINKK